MKEKMKATRLGDVVVTSFDLTDEYHNVAVSMIKDGVRNSGNYTLTEVGMSLADIWVDNAKEDNNLDYGDFLKQAIDNGDELLTLNFDFGSYVQELGEVIVSKC